MTRLEKRLVLARGWHEKAVGDLETARAGLENPRIPPWVVGFHLQQAVEKAWKGQLVLAGTRPPPIHDLRVLLALRTSGNAPLAQTASLITTLQPFAVEERCPLLVPKEASRSELQAVVSSVEAEVKALETAIDGANAARKTPR